MKRVYIFANGEYSSLEFYHSIVKKDDFILCADGGANTAYAAGIIPDLVLGDFDSIDESILEKLKNEKTQFVKFPSEKDESDLEIAISKAISLEPEEIIFFGALGKRLDHIFANLMLLMLPLKAGIKGFILEEDYEIYLIDNKIEIMGDASCNISLFPLTSVVEGIETTGLKYPLNDENLYLGLSRGLSNEFSAETAKIEIKNGNLLIIKTNN